MDLSEILQKNANEVLKVSFQRIRFLKVKESSNNENIKTCLK
jgi:hypothetical protein